MNKQTEMRDFLDAIHNDPRLFTSIVKPGSEGMSCVGEDEIKMMKLFTSSACRSTLAATGAASTWGRRPSGSPGSPSASPGSVTPSSIEAIFPSPIPETQELRDERQKYIHDIAKVCQQLYEDGQPVPG